MAVSNREIARANVLRDIAEVEAALNNATREWMTSVYERLAYPEFSTDPEVETESLIAFLERRLKKLKEDLVEVSPNEALIEKFGAMKHDLIRDEIPAIRSDTKVAHQYTGGRTRVEIIIPESIEIRPFEVNEMIHPTDYKTKRYVLVFWKYEWAGFRTELAYLREENTLYIAVRQ